MKTPADDGLPGESCPRAPDAGRAGVEGRGPIGIDIMTDDRGTESKDELLRLLEEAIDEDSTLRIKAQTVVEGATLAQDVATCLRSCVSAAPDDSVFDARTWERLRNTWQVHNSIARLVGKALSSAQSFALTAQAAGATTSVSFAERSNQQFETPWLKSALLPAAKRLDAVLQRRPLVTDVGASLVRLRLDQKRGSGRGPFEMLEDSRLALERPPGGDSSPVAVLIGLREAIHIVLAQLLTRRRTQEPTSHDRDKVISVGKQCGRTGLPSDHFERIGDDVQTLLATLSGAKQRDVPRDQLIELFNGGLFLLKTFLESLDERMLRP